LEQKGLELADRYWLYQNHRMGRGMEVAPIAEDPERKWLPVALLILTKFDEESDPTGRLKMAQTALLKARDAYRQGDTNAFNLASAEFSARLRAYGEAAGTYPTATVMSMEVLYNRWAPFRIAWILLLSASLAMLLHFGSRWQLLLYAGVASYVSGVAAVLLGFGLRIAISGRPPVTNMYESVVYVGSGVACFGLLFEWIYRKQYTLTAAAVVSTVALVLADNCPLVLDPSVKPLEPVLRSNFWLVTHVMTITLSYAAFALALGIANITLGYFLARSQNKAVIAALSRFTYKALQVGVLLLATGTILGGVWADYSWGRFWGWDPKEVWALIALLGYLAVLHARFAGWVGHRGLATMSVVCFSLVVMAWYGVNFVLGTGLHSYGFGGGGQSYVYAAVVLQFLFMGVALWRSHIDEEEKLGASLPRVYSAEG
jgi:cytochrome c-type biogenesis protein CcsB